MKLERSEQEFSRAKTLFPGGVNSPVRAFRSVGGTPRFIQRANGAYLWDVDGNRYVDYVGAWGPAILGHAHPEVVEAVARTAKDGLCFGAPSVGESDLADAIMSAVPSIEKMRLVSSGTEACMAAIRLARAFTGRNKIVKFTGCYHGHADMLLAKAGSGVATFGLPDSAGVPPETTQHTLTVRYNDIQGLQDMFAAHPSQLAGVILEPIIGNSGFIRPTAQFIQAVESLCRASGTLLIYDEVMTGFRVAWGGAQSLHGVKPDLTILGKVVGGGMPLAVYGGKKTIMDKVAPDGPMYQAGTLSGNPVAVQCGLATLKLLKKHSDFRDLRAKTARLMTGLKDAAATHKISFTADYEGGMFGFFFRSDLPGSYEEAQTADKTRFTAFFQGMLTKGVYLAPSMFEAGFMSLAHTDADIDGTVAAAREVMATLA